MDPAIPLRAAAVIGGPAVLLGILLVTLCSAASMSEPAQAVPTEGQTTNMLAALGVAVGEEEACHMGATASDWDLAMAYIASIGPQAKRDAMSEAFDEGRLMGGSVARARDFPQICKTDVPDALAKADVARAMMKRALGRWRLVHRADLHRRGRFSGA